MTSVHAKWTTVLFLSLLAAAATPQAGLPASLARIEVYTHSNGPYQEVRVTSAEANAYYAGPGAEGLPKGVSNLKFEFHPGVLIGSATVNFDQVMGAHPGGLLQYLFQGTHQVSARAHLDSGQAPRARFTITQVRMDGVVIPNSLLDAAISAFVHPKHPDVGRTFSVVLPKHATSVSLTADAVVVHYPSN